VFNPSRQEVRDFFFESWRKHALAKPPLPLTPLEAIAVDLIAAHPEYHALLSAREAFVDRDYLPENGETNPFLHLSMHLSIREQVSIDQPKGVARHHMRLTQTLGSEMAAEHAMMDCLGEMVWHAQRHGTAPDAGIYLRCLAGK
jgi:hypothetical protein